MLKTPYFVIDELEFNKNVDDFYEALSTYFPNYILGYSFKTNSLPWVIRSMKEKGACAEVVSFDEYRLAKHIQYPIEKIIYNGPMKCEETFFEAIQGGAIVNIETHRELEWLKRLPKDKQYSVGLRVNFDIERDTPGESACGEEGGRFGFCFENGELKKAIDVIDRLHNISLNGLHMHVSSKTRSLNIYKSIAHKSCEIKQRYRLNLSYLDVGGGYFGGMQEKPSFKEYMNVMHEELTKAFNLDELTVIVEPGASIIASPIHFVTSVIDVKDTNRNTFVTTDGSRNDIDPLMSKTSYLYDIELGDEESRELLEKQIVSGFTCMEHDRIFELHQHPRLRMNDRVIYHKVGSYTMCLSPLFIKYFPDVYIKQNAEYFKVRDKWTVLEYMQGEQNNE